jgi:hypothetical protein
MLGEFFIFLSKINFYDSLDFALAPIKKQGSIAF